MKVRNLSVLSDAVRALHWNELTSEVNDSCLRLAVNQGVYNWHCHPDSDELFLVLEGELRVEFEEQAAVTLRPMDTLLVPAGVIHRTSSEVRTVNLCFEKTKAQTVFRDS